MRHELRRGGWRMARQVLWLGSMVDALLATYIMMLSASFVGFGAVAAALAGPNKLIIVAMMLMMMAMQYRSADLDL